MNRVEIKNLCFSYNDDEPVLNHVSLSIEQGTYTSIIGHNGSGKSTIAKLIIGLLAPSDGEIYVDGELLDNKSVRRIRKKIGLVFQNPDNQFIGATVEDDIAFGLENRQIPHKDMPEIVKKFAERVGMSEFLQNEPSRLSGGQKQRVAIAGALALNPEILILDEATSMLDPKGKSDIKQLILEMKKENPNLTIISITHDVEEAYLSDQVIVLSHGQVAFIGKPDEVFSKREVLKNFNLEMPFLLDLKEKLNEELNISIKDCITVDDVAEKLWPSK